jgi:hypothetical protein
MDKLRVTEYSHNFSVGNIPRAMRSVVEKFAAWFDEYELVEMGGTWERAYKQSFSYPQADTEEVEWKDPNLEYRFHINALPHFKQLLAKENIYDEHIERIVEPIYEAVKVDFKIKPHFKPFPEQVPIIEQLKLADPRSKLLPLQTGGGKSYLSIEEAAHLGVMTVYLMKPGYIDKWVNDLDKTLEIELDKIETVMGGEQLKELMRGLEMGYKTPHIVLISNATFRNWISEQEKMPPGELVPGYPCFPWEFMQYCGFGFRVIDEVHQDYHANFRFDLVTHVEQSLSLSATLVTKSDYLKKMYKLAYPDNTWLKVPEHRKYMVGLAWHYDFMYPERIKTTSRGRTSYAHVEFEKSIMQSGKLTKEYFVMIYEIMRRTYLNGRKDPERCLIYFATRKMCEDAVSFFKTILPHLKIAKYNQGDPLTNITESDLCFATLGKAGTAIDVPYLTTVILTVAIDSMQSVLQCSGRLRDIKKLYALDRVPTFVWLVCDNFEKHKRYDRSKYDLLKDKVVSITTAQHNVSLGSR